MPVLYLCIRCCVLVFVQMYLCKCIFANVFVQMYLCKCIRYAKGWVRVGFCFAYVYASLRSLMKESHPSESREGGWMRDFKYFHKIYVKCIKGCLNERSNLYWRPNWKQTQEKKIQQNLHFSSMDMTRWGTGKKPQLFSHSANRCIWSWGLLSIVQRASSL